MMKNHDAAGQRRYVHTKPAVQIGPRGDSEQTPVAPTETGDPSDPPTTAIIAWHGMGQQLPFETVEAIARGLAERQRGQSGQSEPSVAVRLVQLGNQKLWRAELVLPDDAGRPHPVHVYEAYWAPCTQGRITLAETVMFLIAAGYHGVRYALWPPRLLHRFLFDRWVAFRLSPGLAMIYIVLLATLLSLVFVNFAITTVVSVKLLTGPGNPTSWPSVDLLRDLTVDLSLLALAFGASGGAFTAAYWTQKANRRDAVTSERHVVIRHAIWTLLTVSILVTLVVGVLFAYHLFVHSAWGDPTWAWPAFISRAAAPWYPTSWFGSVAWLALAIFIWLAALAGSAAVRWFLLEFVGDAAIYVSSHKLNRFYEARQRIRDNSTKVATAVYEFGRYNRHILMGHSLGSVIAYDTLNRLIVDDRLSGEQLRVTERTALLLTFGSILDKTAFLFRSQSEFGDVREAMASTSQPLINDPCARPVWINIYSRDDILSGSLEYYDVQNGAQPASSEVPGASPIDNQEDPHAWIPLLAHNQYLSNKHLLDTLANTITARAPM